MTWFPTPADHDLSDWRKAVGRLVGPHLAGVTENIEYGKGWFPPEGGRRRQWVWTSGDGILALPEVDDLKLVMELGRPAATVRPSCNWSTTSATRLPTSRCARPSRSTP